jgi:hypothetical protein
MGPTEYVDRGDGTPVFRALRLTAVMATARRHFASIPPRELEIGVEACE